MIINYEFIKKDKKFTTGTFYVFNPTLCILVNCDFSITNMQVSGKVHKSIVFKKWEKQTFDDSIQSLKTFLAEKSDNKLILLCSYNTSDHPDKLESDIKNDISKRVLEFTKIKL